MNKTLFEFSNIEELEKSIFEKYNSDEEFKKEREKVYYKSFKISDLFSRRVIRTKDIAVKNLDISENITLEKTLRVVSGSKLNNGVIGYIVPDNSYNIERNKISIANVGTPGVCFYHNYDFAAFTDTAVIDFNNNELYSSMTKKAYELFALYFTKIYATKLHPAFVRWISTGNDFNRELILLPVYQDEDNQEHISVKTLSYLYDRIKFNEYKQKIEKLEKERHSIKSSLELYENNLNNKARDILFSNHKLKTKIPEFYAKEILKKLLNIDFELSDKPDLINKEKNISCEVTFLNAAMQTNKLKGELAKKCRFMSGKEIKNYLHEMKDPKEPYQFIVSVPIEFFKTKTEDLPDNEKFFTIKNLNISEYREILLDNIKNIIIDKNKKLENYTNYNDNNLFIDCSEFPFINNFDEILVTMGIFINTRLIISELSESLKELDNKFNKIFIYFPSAQTIFTLDGDSIKEESKVNVNLSEFEILKGIKPDTITYKAFKVGDLFERKSVSLGIPMKELGIQQERENSNDILLVSESKENNGFNGYIKNNMNYKTDKDSLTMSDQFARCFYQKERYSTTTSHVNTIFSKLKFWDSCTEDSKKFLAEYFTLIYQKFHNYNRKVCCGNDFNREIIILPCYEDNLISTSKMAELYQKSVIKSKENQITEREINQRNNGCNASVSQDNLKISTSMMGYLYTLVRVNQFNKKAKELQDEIINF